MNVTTPETGAPLPARIVFPCAYPIKVVGIAGAEFRAHVHAVMARHAPDFEPAAVTSRDSRLGSYQSLTITVHASGREQLQAIFIDLKASALVKIVL